MTSSANPDLWSDLSNFGSPAGDSDACAALLKVNAEMFVAAPAHDRESIATFESLVLGFLPKADAATLDELARILAPCRDTPASVLDHLARHSHAAHDIVVRQGVRLPPSPTDRLLATPSGRLHLASHPNLDATTVRRLLALRESAVEDSLAANATVPPESPSFMELLRRARRRPALASLLLDRVDLPTAVEASLYLAADTERRRAIRERIGTALAHRRASLSFTLAESDLADLGAAAFKGDEHRMEALLNLLLGFPEATEWRMLETGRHRLLALGLKVLGVSRKDAIRIFAHLHPALAYPLSTLRGLVREMRDVTDSVALVLIESILDVRALSAEELA